MKWTGLPLASSFAARFAVAFIRALDEDGLPPRAIDQLALRPSCARSAPGGRGRCPASAAGCRIVPAQAEQLADRVLLFVIE